MQNPLMSTILATDSYKVSHYLQYPPGTQHVCSYIEARGGEFTEIPFFGLQAFVKKYLLPRITEAHVKFAKTVLEAHGLPFNYGDWIRVVTKHDGRLPLRIQAVPEGTIMKPGNVMVQVTNTDPEMPWLTSYIETALLRAIWYPSTVGALSRRAKQVIYQGLVISAEDPNAEIQFKLHDFGARGATSQEAAMLGGMGHLLNFMGTDTVEALIGTMEYYGMDEPVGFSIPATEHSTVTSWGKDNELDMFRHYLESHPTGLIACVSDSFDIFKATSHYWGTELKESVLARDGTLVVRPDSGNPTTMPLDVIEILMDKFGYTTNSKGFRVLPPQVRVIQGDGMDINAITRLITNAIERGISTENFSVGMGGGLLQKVNRDTSKWAMKANAIMINGEWRDVYKDPITDQGKKSKRGRLALIDGGSGLVTVREDDLPHGAHGTAKNHLRTVYENGILEVDEDFVTIRGRAEL